MSEVDFEGSGEGRYGYYRNIKKFMLFAMQIDSIKVNSLNALRR